MRRYSTFGDEGQLFVRFHSDPGAVIEFYDTMKRSAHLEPEKRLMLALLDDALKCYQKNLGAKSRRGKKLFDEAEQWFWERDGADVFSFEHVCTSLGLSPGYVLRMLDKWKAAARAAGTVNRPGLDPARRTRKRLRHAA